MFNLNNAAKIQLLEGKSWKRTAGNGNDQSVTARMILAGLVTKTIEIDAEGWAWKVYTLTDAGVAMQRKVGMEIMEMAVAKTTTNHKRINALVSMMSSKIETAQSGSPRRARRAAVALQSYCTAWGL